MQASQLSCPHCGAGVSATSNHCAHCNTELMLESCPRCLSRAFAGHKHCPQCGSELGHAVAGTPVRELPCPRCQLGLHARVVGEIVIDECGQCLGLFLDQTAIRRILEDRRQARAEALLGDLPRAEINAGVKPGQRMYLPCPVCKTIMNRKQFATGAGVVVDVCKAHGTFFDKGELPAIIDFVMKGGLEKAAAKDLERQRQDLARERERVEAAAASAHVTPIDTSRSTALVDLLFALIR